MRLDSGDLVLALALVLAHGGSILSADDGASAVVGPETEERFPPLVIPDGFEATLFACDPLVEYPSVISLGPEPGTLFVAHDYVTGLGVDIVRRDEVRLLRDTECDGYADQSTVFAADFNSIQGLAWDNGSVYVMNAPWLTKLTDTDGDGIADQREDLLEGIGQPPEITPDRLHCANGVVRGYDGWLYLAVGDRGCDVQRPEGDHLVFQEGGILRCRPDGRDLHVYSRGLRNIYDVALDEELNVFVRDNENDGGDYLVRVCHCFHGSDHGYPYLYRDAPREAMPPVAEFGKGASAGITAYLETAFPAEYRSRLLFCEWGRAVETWDCERRSSSFASTPKVEFVAGAANDPYGFHPTDLVVDHDGSLLISDWGDGQRPKRGRGRIYRITSSSGAESDLPDHGNSLEIELGPVAEPADDPVRLLNSASYYARLAAQRRIALLREDGASAVLAAMDAGELSETAVFHAVWILAEVLGRDAADDLFALAESHSDPRVRAQAVRAIADLFDPVLVNHRLDTGPGNSDVCRRLAKIACDDSRVHREILIALGRLRWEESAAWLESTGVPAEPALEHAAMVMLRRSRNWPSVLRLLDAADSAVRPIALRSLSRQANDVVAAGLLSRLDSEPDATQRIEYLDLLAKVYRRPAEWTYWGFRPPPRPPNSVDWEFTDRIAAAMTSALADADESIRGVALSRMLQEAINVPLPALTVLLDDHPNDAITISVLTALKSHPAVSAHPILHAVLKDHDRTDEIRLTALEALVAEDCDSASETLLDLVETLDEGPVLLEVLNKVASMSPLETSGSVLLKRLESADADVRAAVIGALESHCDSNTALDVSSLLADDDIRVRRSAAIIAAMFPRAEATESLLAAAVDGDRQLRNHSLRALLTLNEPRSVPAALESLAVPDCQVAALKLLGRLGSPADRDAVLAVTRSSRSTDVLTEAIRTLGAWQKDLSAGSQDRFDLVENIARIQGESGMPLLWRVAGPFDHDVAARQLERLTSRDPDDENDTEWRELIAGAADPIPPSASDDGSGTLIAFTRLLTVDSEDIEFLLSDVGVVTVWLNDSEIFSRDAAGKSDSGTQRIASALQSGFNRLVVQHRMTEGTFDIGLRFRRRSTRADHESLTAKALTTNGDPGAGRRVFENEEKSLCIRCHRVDGQGGNIGPDLSGIGERFSRIHLIESILNPSHTVAPSYETLSVVLRSGLVVSGVRVAETPTVITLGDLDGKTLDVEQSEIEEILPQSRSTMPDGLERRVTEQEFVDLIGFLSSRKSNIASRQHQ